MNETIRMVQEHSHHRSLFPNVSDKRLEDVEHAAAVTEAVEAVIDSTDNKK